MQGFSEEVFLVTFGTFDEELCEEHSLMGVLFALRADARNKELFDNRKEAFTWSMWLETSTGERSSLL